MGNSQWRDYEIDFVGSSEEGPGTVLSAGEMNRVRRSAENDGVSALLHHGQGVAGADDLKVTATTGRNVSIAAGRGIIHSDAFGAVAFEVDAPVAYGPLPANATSYIFAVAVADEDLTVDTRTSRNVTLTHSDSDELTNGLLIAAVVTGPSSVSSITDLRHILTPVRWQGDWSDAASYAPGDLVVHQGALWLATEASTDSEPADDNADWQGAGGSGGVGGAPLHGSSAPDDGDGVDGQWYIQTTTGNWWVKNAGTWGSAVGNLAGITDNQRAALAGTSGTPSGSNKFVTAAGLTAHTSDTANPHSVTKSQVGLANVTNDAQLKAAENLADLPSASDARDNLGLGSIATQDADSLELAGDADAGGFRWTNVADGMDPGDAVNRGQLDALASGYVDKLAVNAVATSNLALTGLSTIDGVPLVAGNRVLATGQTVPTQNGIWVAASGAWSRPADADVSATLSSGTRVAVISGSSHAGKAFVLIEAAEVDTDAQVWTESGAIGTGETNTISNVGTEGTSLVSGKVGADLQLRSIAIDSGSSSILSLAYNAGTKSVRLAIETAGFLLKSLFTSKGQLLAGTGSGATAALSPGTDGQALVADGAQTTGLKYASVIHADGSTPLAANWDAGAFNISSSAPPTEDDHLVNLAYANGLDAGTKNRGTVRTTTDFNDSSAHGSLPAHSSLAGVLTASANGSLNSWNGGSGIGGVNTLVPGDVILVRHEGANSGETGDPSENNAYVVTQVGDGSSPWILTRAASTNTGDKLQRSLWTITDGVRNGQQMAVEYVDGGITLGTTPVRIVRSGASGPAGVGVPAGGDAGQVLAKINGTDYNTHWVDQTGGGGSGDATSIQGVDVDATAPSDGQVLVYDAGEDAWKPTTPSGGGGGIAGAFPTEPPETPEAGSAWLDVAATTPRLMLYNGSAWFRLISEAVPTVTPESFSGLVRYYKRNDPGTGSSWADQVDGNHATLLGSTDWAADGVEFPASSGASANMNGIPVGAAPRTFMARVKLADFDSASNTVFHVGTTDTLQRFVLYLEDGWISVGLYGGDFSKPYATPLDTIITVAITYDGTVLQVWANGEPVGLPVAETLDTFDSGTLYLGRTNSGANVFDGVFYSFAVWDRALDAEEIADLADSVNW